LAHHVLHVGGIAVRGTVTRQLGIPFSAYAALSKKRLHHNVLAIALANKLARSAWAVLHKGRAFECVKTNAPRPA
jgi:hypothetical protein